MTEIYVHPERRSGDSLYNFNLIRWLIMKGIISSNKKIKILDLGSGRGHFYFALKQLGYQNIFASDRAPMFKECIAGDITGKLPFENATFDLVLSRDLAEHIANHEQFFKEHYRILKPEGKIIVMTPNAEKMSLGEFYTDYTHVMPYTRKSLREALLTHGFSQVQVTRLRAIPKLWMYTLKAFDILFSRKHNNLLGVGVKKSS